MLSFVVIMLVLGLAGICNGTGICDGADKCGSVVSTEVEIPRGYTREAYLKSIIDYWTPERMASAKPLHPIIDKKNFNALVNSDRQNGVEQVLTPSTLPPDTCASDPPAAGKVFMTMGGVDYVCSGSVVNATNYRTVVTAGHCVYDTASKKFATKLIFVPGYNNGAEPYGRFVASLLATTEKWANEEDFNCDVGLVLLNPTEDGKHVQQKVKAFGITVNPKEKDRTKAYGYPVDEKTNGQIISSCDATSDSPSWLIQLLFLPDFDGLQLPCGMTGGSSGGPWIRNFVTGKTPPCQQVSLVSFGITLIPGIIFGPYFTCDNIGILYYAYHNK